MDRSLATKEVPLLNRGEPYVPDAGRTYEDDEALVYDAKGTIRERTHISNRDFERIYNATMKYYTVQEKYLFKQYQTGEKKNGKGERVKNLAINLGERFSLRTDINELKKELGEGNNEEINTAIAEKTALLTELEEKISAEFSELQDMK